MPHRPGPTVLTKRGTDALVRVERLMDDATRALATGAGPSKATDAQGVAPAPQDTFGRVRQPEPVSRVRGN